MHATRPWQPSEHGFEPVMPNDRRTKRKSNRNFHFCSLTTEYFFLISQLTMKVTQIKTLGALPLIPQPTYSTEKVGGKGATFKENKKIYF